MARRSSRARGVDGTGYLVHRYDGYGHDQGCRYENTEPTKDQDVGRRAPALTSPVRAHPHCAVIRTGNLLLDSSSRTSSSRIWSLRPDRAICSTGQLASRTYSSAPAGNVPGWRG